MKKITTLILTSIFAISILSGQNAPEPADRVLKDACRQAAAEKKNVMIIFHASWCGWCKKLDAAMNDPACKDFFEKSYVIRHLTILESKEKKNLENPGANELYEQNGGKGSGIPYMLIFDRNGKMLSDSKMTVTESGQAKRSNIGCPSSDAEITAFVEILKKTSSINDSQAEKISRRFAQNRN